VKQEKVNVEGETPTLDVNPRIMPSAIRAQRQRFWMRSRRSDELLADLQRGGPSAGDGGQLYIDGFTADNFRRSRQFARFASIKIRFRPNTIGWATDASKFSPNPGRTNTTDSSPSWETTRAEHAQSILSATLPQAPYDSVISRATSAADSTRRHRSFSTSSGATSTNSLWMRRSSAQTSSRPAFDQSVPTPYPHQP